MLVISLLSFIFEYDHTVANKVVYLHRLMVFVLEFCREQIFQLQVVKSILQLLSNLSALSNYNFHTHYVNFSAAIYDVDYQDKIFQAVTSLFPLFQLTVAVTKVYSAVPVATTKVTAVIFEVRCLQFNFVLLSLTSRKRVVN